MENKSLLKICIIFSFTDSFLLQATQQLEHMRNINPIIDLRSPRSLYEELHDGIDNIYVSLESCLNLSNNLLSVLENAKNDLSALSKTYDNTINTTRNHQVYREDKESLQKMIDRLTALIDELENKSDNNIDQLTQDAVKSVKGCCDNLKTKISN